MRSINASSDDVPEKRWNEIFRGVLFAFRVPHALARIEHLIRWQRCMEKKKNPDHVHCVTLPFERDAMQCHFTDPLYSICYGSVFGIHILVGVRRAYALWAGRGGTPLTLHSIAINAKYTASISGPKSDTKMILILTKFLCRSHLFSGKAFCVSILSTKR